jgi:hypothetical protein
MDDLPDVAHLFRWAIAAELLTARATRIVPGPRARDLERDPLSAWFTAAITLLGYGLLDGFQPGGARFMWSSWTPAPGRSSLRSSR